MPEEQLSPRRDEQKGVWAAGPSLRHVVMNIGWSTGEHSSPRGEELKRIEETLCRGTTLLPGYSLPLYTTLYTILPHPGYTHPAGHQHSMYAGHPAEQSDRALGSRGQNSLGEERRERH